jgi:two-component system, OmpR family, response regulator CpxR
LTRAHRDARAGVVLVVDDDEDLRDAYATLLAKEGYRVACAPNGWEALNYLRDHRAPSVILLDVTMPVMDGIEFRREQASDGRLRGIPVLVLTGEPGGPGVVTPEADGFLRKPFGAPELVQAIDAITARDDTTGPL